MEVLKIETRRLVENIYIIIEGDGAIIIDPGYEFDSLVDLIENRDLKLEKILLTHGHGDHIGSCEQLRAKYNTPVYAHEKERELLLDPNLNLSAAMYGDISLEADFYVNEDSEVYFNDHKIEFIYTPGHTIGSQCIKIGQNLFTGDTLFRNSIGRTDLPTSNPEDMKNSLEKIKLLDDELIVYPGHNSSSTIGDEKKYNQFLI
ncbi:MBL fold metallo-hydrolase [Mediannikoviicoccus vaginalis]|uniref:MBL fold metallo-hydrolase n=1 Tax=Mediannikoviicoccus vaginalis TaxID=2899727 RepID=UPI001F3EC638|nr:MBL fold metallo-hydrolase [Mediannikoviicoccus vaginalis]